MAIGGIIEPKEREAQGEAERKRATCQPCPSSPPQRNAAFQKLMPALLGAPEANLTICERCARKRRHNL